MCLLTQTRGMSKVSQFEAKSASLEDTQEGLNIAVAISFRRQVAVGRGGRGGRGSRGGKTTG